MNDRNSHEPRPDDGGFRAHSEPPVTRKFMVGPVRPGDFPLRLAAIPYGKRVCRGDRRRAELGSPSAPPGPLPDL